MLKKLTPWLAFVSCLALLGTGASTFGPLTDHIAVALRFSVLIFLSTLVVRERFRQTETTRGQKLVQTLNRWYRGEKE
jgi:hypothetical protein